METHQAPDSNTEAIKVRDNSLIYEYKVATEGTSAVCDATATATHGASVASGAAAECASSLRDIATEGISATQSSSLENAAEPRTPQNPAVEFFESIGKGIDELGKNVERTFSGKGSRESSSMSTVACSGAQENPAAEFFDNIGKGFMGMFGA